MYSDAKTIPIANNHGSGQSGKRSKSDSRCYKPEMRPTYYVSGDVPELNYYHKCMNVVEKIIKFIFQMVGI